MTSASGTIRRGTLSKSAERHLRRKLPELIARPVLLVSFLGVAVAGLSYGTFTLSGTYTISASATDGGSTSAYAGMVAYDGKGESRIHIRYGGPSQEKKEDHGKCAVAGN